MTVCLVLKRLTGTATVLQRYSSREAISEGDKAGVAFHDSSFFTSTRGGLKKME